MARIRCHLDVHHRHPHLVDIHLQAYKILFPSLYEVRGTCGKNEWFLCRWNTDMQNSFTGTVGKIAHKNTHSNILGNTCIRVFLQATRILRDTKDTLAAPLFYNSRPNRLDEGAFGIYREERIPLPLPEDRSYSVTLALCPSKPTFQGILDRNLCLRDLNSGKTRVYIHTLSMMLGLTWEIGHGR